VRCSPTRAPAIGRFDHLLPSRGVIYRCQRRPKARSCPQNHPESGECRLFAGRKTMGFSIRVAFLRAGCSGGFRLRGCGGSRRCLQADAARRRTDRVDVPHPPQRGSAVDPQRDNLLKATSTKQSRPPASPVMSAGLAPIWTSSSSSARARRGVVSRRVFNSARERR
jgi:hypothetical protein